MKPLATSIAELITLLDGKGDAAPKTLDLRLADAKASVIEIQTQVDALTRENATAMRERDEARTNAQNLQTQFDAATETATTAQAELATAKTSISTLTRERDEARATNTTKDTRIGNLESLCRIRGLNPNEAPTTVDQPKDTLTYAQLEVKYAAAKTDAERKEIVGQMEAAAAAKKATKK